jgi:hypothetical protein
VGEQARDRPSPELHAPMEGSMSLRRYVTGIQSFLRQRREALDFQDLKDPRRRRGRRWSLGALVSTAVLSLMMLARSLREAERISRDLWQAQRRRGIKRRVPDSTLGDLLAALPVAPVRRHLHQHVLAEHRRRALEPTVVPIRFVSIDGKTVATLDSEVNRHCQRQQQQGQAPLWLYRVVRATVISSAAAVCIDQAPIPAATNDGGVFPSFFRRLRTTYGRSGLFEGVFTDAGFAAEANARQVDDAGFAYVMGLKDNQPSLRQEAERVLGAQARGRAPEAETGWESDSSRGWIRRQLWRTAGLGPPRRRRHLAPGARPLAHRERLLRRARRPVEGRPRPLGAARPRARGGQSAARAGVQPARPAAGSPPAIARRQAGCVVAAA